MTAARKRRVFMWFGAWDVAIKKAVRERRTSQTAEVVRGLAAVGLAAHGDLHGVAPHTHLMVAHGRAGVLNHTPRNGPPSTPGVSTTTPAAGWYAAASPQSNGPASGPTESRTQASTRSAGQPRR